MGAELVKESIELEQKKVATYARLTLVDFANLGKKDGPLLLIETPYAGGGEFKTINRLDEKTLKLYADHLCDQLKMFWRRYGLLHLDIKPSNIIIKYPDIPLLIDFGLSVFMNDKVPFVDGYTRSYSSKNQQNLGEPCKWDDVEALCNTFYAMEIGLDV